MGGPRLVSDVESLSLGDFHSQGKLGGGDALVAGDLLSYVHRAIWKFHHRLPKRNGIQMINVFYFSYWSHLLSIGRLYDCRTHLVIILTPSSSGVRELVS